MSDPSRDRRRKHVAPGPLVLALLIATCLGMLYAIYYVVKTGKM